MVQLSPLDIDSSPVKRGTKDEIVQLASFMERASSAEGEGRSVMKRLKREMPVVQVGMCWGVQILKVTEVWGLCLHRRGRRPFGNCQSSA